MSRYIGTGGCGGTYFQDFAIQDFQCAVLLFESSMNIAINIIFSNSKNCNNLQRNTRSCYIHSQKVPIVIVCLFLFMFYRLYILLLAGPEPGGGSVNEELCTIVVYPQSSILSLEGTQDIRIWGCQCKKFSGNPKLPV